MTPAAIPLAINFGQASPGIAAGGRLLNLYPQPAPAGAKAETVLCGVPGKRLFAQLRYLNDASQLTDETEIQAIIGAFGKAIVVGRHAIYAVEQDGTWARLHNAAGMAAPVSVAFNRFDVAAVNGTNAWWIRPTEVVSIAGSDPDFMPADTVTYLDTYLVFNRRGTEQVFSTMPGSRDMSGLDFAAAEKAPDNTVGVLAAGESLFVFGQDTTEVWYNAGLPQFPFARTPGATMEHGCAAAATARQFDGTVFWLTSAGLVVMASGMQPSRISDGPVEEALKARRADWSGASAYVYSDEGHTFYVMTVGDLTLAYDMASGAWNQRGNYSRGHVLERCYAQVWGRHLVGDDRGRILEMRSDVHDDAGEPLVAEVITLPLSNNRLRAGLGALEIEMDTGATPLGAPDYQVMLSPSRDGGRTWGSERPASIGAQGDYGRVVQWRKLGSALDHRFRIRMSDPFRRRILASAWVRL